MTHAALHNEPLVLEQLAQGETAALATIYRHYWDWLYLFSYNILKDKPACEDIIQDVFVRLWTNRDRLNIKLSLKAYLFASCRYSLYRAIRSEGVREDIFEDIDQRLETLHPTPPLEHQELLSAIEHITSGLPPKCQEVFRLSREEHLSHAAIAERLQLSVKTVENHMARALQQFRKELPGLLSAQLIIWLLERP